MSNILDVMPDAKGGQLKFRVDAITCLKSCDSIKELCDDGEIVDIFLEDTGNLIGFARTQSISDFNTANLMYGRPKGYGVVLWVSSAMMVIWSPFIGDEGYFSNE